MMDFSGKVCVVTGGAGGIGRRIVREFAARGAKTIFIDWNEEAGEQLLSELMLLGHEVMFFPGDIGQEDHLNRFAAAVSVCYGQIDYLINNACISKRGILSGCDYSDFNQVLRIGVTAPYWLTHLFLPYFAPHAAVVNISSTRQGMSQADTESYTAAKGGIGALTHALAVSLSGRARVNAISPGWIDTRVDQEETFQPDYSPADLAQHPSGRVGRPMDIASLVLYLCHPSSSFINGQNITVDGGMSKRMIYHGDEGWHLDV